MASIFDAHDTASAVFNGTCTPLDLVSRQEFKVMAREDG